MQKKTLKHYALSALLIFCAVNLSGQTMKKVLFLGNSYTGVNNLPQMVSDMATSAGKILVFDSNTPGGYYLAHHLNNSTSMQKLNNGEWDHVVLQEQSLALAYQSTFMNAFRFSVTFDSLIKVNDACTQLLFYATWGRKNGDQYICTSPECPADTLIVRNYYEMDASIEKHYKFFADSLKASVTPVGAVWRYLRQNHPTLELFQADESHPSLAGTYAAACSFYTTIFRSDPTLITYNASLSLTDVTIIKQAVKTVVFDSLLKWNVGPFDTLLSSYCNPLSVGTVEQDDAEWNVFPNPFTEILNIQAPKNVTKQALSVYNIFGVFVKELEVSQTSQVSFDELPNGLYILKVENSPHVFRVYKR